MKMPRGELDAALGARIEEGEALQARRIEKYEHIEKLRADYHTWWEYNRDLLRASFTTDEIAEEYASFAGRTYAMDPTPEQEHQLLSRDLAIDVRKLDSLRKRLTLYADPQPASASAPRTPAASASGAVFLVHGSNAMRKVEVARFLEGLGLKVVILHEQANQGRTLIEKFEDHAGDVGYAVVLLTADDEGGPSGGERGPRARQNVVFELGFFYGRLGRNRVCVLYESGVEPPSDVGGIAYVPIEGDWKLQLGRELTSARIEFDPRKMLS